MHARANRINCDCLRVVVGTSCDLRLFKIIYSKTDLSQCTCVILSLLGCIASKVTVKFTVSFVSREAANDVFRNLLINRFM
jgi:hypothetical protein